MTTQTSNYRIAIHKEFIDIRIAILIRMADPYCAPHGYSGLMLNILLGVKLVPHG